MMIRIGYGQSTPMNVESSAQVAEGQEEQTVQEHVIDVF